MRGEDPHPLVNRLQPGNALLEALPPVRFEAEPQSLHSLPEARNEENGVRPIINSPTTSEAERGLERGLLLIFGDVWYLFANITVILFFPNSIYEIRTTFCCQLFQT
ncbi:hypothetical protein CK510_19055 [Brunnivagina elsteri CCALA 953]|uniref:Uncharacterized protein n=1 Tax=Brunnivagina elsteri CCALA 953 TaxID=987040 RepID=A0A2A2TGE7_9CYAN|nr:hypothetical protein CK510_19055 [Calothrix elsteri CCALA 953]